MRNDGSIIWAYEVHKAHKGWVHEIHKDLALVFMGERITVSKAHMSDLIISLLPVHGLRFLKCRYGEEPSSLLNWVVI